MDNQKKKELYESIMAKVAKQVKRAIDEGFTKNRLRKSAEMEIDSAIEDPSEICSVSPYILMTNGVVATRAKLVKSLHIQGYGWEEALAIANRAIAKAQAVIDMRLRNGFDDHLDRRARGDEQCTDIESEPPF